MKMNNNYKSREKIKNSNIDNSYFFKTINAPNIFLNPKKFPQLNIRTNILENISLKESQLYKSFTNNFGKRFIEIKPASLILFENRLREYFISSNFLRSFTRKKSIDLNERINMGSLDYYSLKDKKYKEDVMNSANRGNILSKSRNFELKPSKDLVHQEFFKMKFQQKNAKRIAKILNKRNKNNLIELKEDLSDLFSNKNNDDSMEEFKKFKLNNYFFRNKKEKLENHLTEGDPLKSLNINIDNDSKICNSPISNAKSKDLANFEIYEYTQRNKKKTKTNYWLNSSHSNISLSKENINNKISSSILKAKKHNLNLTEYKKHKKKILSRNEDILYLKDKFHTNKTEENTTKKKRLFLLDYDKIKNLSKKYNININQNINILDNYTKGCKSKLLKLLFANNIKNKMYIIKKEKETELNELKDLLFGKKANINRNGNNNKSKDKSINKLKLSKTNNNTLNPKNFINPNNIIINKKSINLELKEIIKNVTENSKKKKINFEKIRERFKSNYKTIKKMRANIKYNKKKLYDTFRRYKSK